MGRTVFTVEAEEALSANVHPLIVMSVTDALRTLAVAADTEIESLTTLWAAVHMVRHDYIPGSSTVRWDDVADHLSDVVAMLGYDV